MPWLRVARASSSRPMPSPGSAMRARPRSVGRVTVMAPVSRRAAAPRNPRPARPGRVPPVTSDHGRVAALARYPVKSLAGEGLAEATVEPRGIAGDRTWAVYTEDGGIGSGKTTRRFRRVDGLLGLSARSAGGAPVVTPPDGRSVVAGTAEADGLLSVLLGRPLRLAAEADVPHHDEAPVHVVTTAAVRRVAELLGAPVDVS